MNSQYATSQSKKTSSEAGWPGETSPASKHEYQPLEDAAEYARNFARERPEVAALWCLGVGFILGWKLKPW